MRYIVTFPLLLFFLLNVKGQVTQPIILTRSIDTSVENGGLMPTVRIVNISQFHVEQKQTNFIIKEFYFQPLRYYNQLLKEGLIDQAGYEFHKRRFNDINDHSCSDSSYKLQMLVSLDSLKNKTIIFDINHNKDFTDDSAYIFQPVNSKLVPRQKINDLPIIAVPVTFCVSGSSYVLDTMFIRPYPYESAYKYNDEMDSKFYLLIQNATSKKGYFEVEGIKYSIIASTSLPLPVYNLPATRFFINNMESQKKELHYYEMGDTVKLKRGDIKLHSISRFGDTVYYRKTFSQSSFDPWKNLGLSISSVDVNGDPHNLQFNNKLTLLDFWGTWCQPCIALLPELSALHKSLKYKGFATVSIAYDEKKSLAGLKKIIAKGNMEWLNLFQDMEDKSNASLVNKFKITSFPTYILVNSAGKVVMRREGKEGFQEIASYAKHLLSHK